MAKSTLSERQEHILETIRDYTNENGYPPTLREIGKRVGISSTSVVSYNLKALEHKGFLDRMPDKSRGLRLVEEAVSFVNVPLLGTIAAGIPIPVPEDSTFEGEMDSVGVSTEMLHAEKDVFALKVRGKSMIDAFINDGDVVLVRPQESAVNGELVAAWIIDQQETTLKRFYQEPGSSTVELRAENGDFPDLTFAASNVEIKGKIVGVIREIS